MAKNDVISKQIGQRIREARERKRWSQAELAECIGKYSSAISNYETGTSMMHVSELPAIATALDVTIAYLYGEEPKATLNKKLSIKLDKLSMRYRLLAQQLTEHMVAVLIREQGKDDVLTEINQTFGTDFVRDELGERLLNYAELGSRARREGLMKELEKMGLQRKIEE